MSRAPPLNSLPMTSHRPAIALNKLQPVLSTWQGPAPPAEQSSTWTGDSAARAAVRIPMPRLPASRPRHLRHPPFPRHLPRRQHIARTAAHGRMMPAGNSAAHAERPGSGLLHHTWPPSTLGLLPLPRLRKRSPARPNSPRRLHSTQCRPRRSSRPFRRLHRLYRLQRSYREFADWESALSPWMSSSRSKSRSGIWQGPHGCPASTLH